MSIAAQKRAALVVASTALLFLAILGAVAYEALRYPDTRVDGPLHEAKVTIHKGSTLGDIAQRLADAGLIVHPTWFRFYANERGMAQKIRAGEYTLTSDMSPKQVLQRLVQGTHIVEASVTIPEGKNIEQVAHLLDAAGVCSGEEAIKLMRDVSFVRSLGIPAPNETLEGYLYPDTYRFRAASPAAKILAQLVKHSQDVLAQLKKQSPDGVEQLKKQYNFDDREIVLMASLVERETAEPDERPRIAGVFLNRLRLPTFVPHVLQTDPTIIYGCTIPTKKSAACRHFEGRIRRMHLEDKDNLYNTYTHEGLPPGPISNPGSASLLAVLQPDATPFLYFVAKNDGTHTHHFSKTRAEHEAAVNRFIRNRPANPPG